MPDDALTINSYSLVVGSLDVAVIARDPGLKAGQSISDTQGRLVHLIENSIRLAHQVNCTYDALGNLRKVKEGSQLRYFGYDSPSRVVGATTQFAQSYDYDRYGNRTINQSQTSANLPHPKRTVDTNTNRLVAPAGYSYVYDAAGNQIADNYTGAGSRTFDAEDHLKQAQGSPTIKGRLIPMMEKADSSNATGWLRINSAHGEWLLTSAVLSLRSSVTINCPSATRLAALGCLAGRTDHSPGLCERLYQTKVHWLRGRCRDRPEFRRSALSIFSAGPLHIGRSAGRECERRRPAELQSVQLRQQQPHDSGGSNGNDFLGRALVDH